MKTDETDFIFVFIYSFLSISIRIISVFIIDALIGRMNTDETDFIFIFIYPFHQYQSVSSAFP